MRGGTKTGKLTFQVERKADGFWACVYTGPNAWGTDHCAKDTNPRKALGAALRKVAGQISERSGHFKGLSKRRRRK